MLELILVYAMFAVTVTAVGYAYRLTRTMHSDEYREQVCFEVLKERRGLGSSDVR